VHIAVLRIRLQQASQRYLLLIAELTRKLVRRQVIEEWIRNCGAEQCLVLIAEARVGEVEPLIVRIAAAEIRKIGDIGHEPVDEIGLEGNVEAIIARRTKFERVRYGVAAEIGVTPERFTER